MSIPNLILTFTQIALETVPVSSSAHVIIFKKLYATLTESPTFFAEYFYQLCNIPTLLVLIIYFRKDLRQLIFPKTKVESFSFNFLQLFGMAVIASNITVFFYFLSKQTPPHYQFVPTHPLLIILAMSITATLLLSLKFIPKHKNFVEPQMTLANAALLGLVQTISLTPGISRFASTYVTCRWLGNNGSFSLRFSFLLHSILTCGLLLRALLCRWQKTANILSAHCSWAMLPVIILAMFVSFWLLRLADIASNNNQFWRFGFYLLAPICLTLALWKIG